MSGNDNKTATGKQVRQLLHEAVHDIAENEFEKLCDPKKCIVLFSGGVDSSISLHLAASLLGVRHAITVLVQDTPANDAPWAEETPNLYSDIDHVILRPTLAELLEKDMPFLVESIQSFDGMALRNSVCATHALRHAASLGFTYVLTGDAADELMGGYRFTHRYDAKAWSEQRATMVARMHFDSIQVGAALGMRVTSPYLYKPFVDFCLQHLQKADCIGPFALRVAPTAPLEDGVVTGKLPLRRAFPELLSSSRRKDPQEVGCGTTLLGAAPWATPPRPGYFDSRIKDEEFDLEKERVLAAYAVTLRDKEHLAYFLVFEEVFGRREDARALKEVRPERRLEVPGKSQNADDPCPACRFALGAPTQTFCLTCGHYDEALRFRHAGTKGLKGDV